MARRRLAISLILVSTLLLLDVEAKSVDPYKVRVFFSSNFIEISSQNEIYLVFYLGCSILSLELKVSLLFALMGFEYL